MGEQGERPQQDQDFGEVSTIKSLLRLRQFVKPYRFRFFSGIGMFGVARLLEAMVPVLTASAINKMTMDIYDVREELFGIALAVLLRYVAISLARFSVRRVGLHVAFDLRNKLYEHLQFQGSDFFSKNSIGDMMTRAVADISLIQRLFSAGSILLIILVYASATGFGFMLYYSPSLTLLLLPPLPLIFIYAFHTARSLGKTSTEVQERLSDIGTHTQENLSGIRTIQALVQEENEINNFSKTNQRYANAFQKQAQINSSMAAWMPSMAAACSIVIIGYGGHQVQNGEIMIGDLVAFFMFLNMVIQPFRVAGFIINLFQRAAIGSDRLFEVFDLPPEIIDQHKGGTVGETKGHLQISALTFRYPGEERYAIKDVSVEVQPGDILAIMGRVGSGKSTILKQVVRLLDPEPERIFLDGVDVRDFSLSELRKLVALVPQDPFLFAEPLKDNLTYDDPERTLNLIWDAASSADLSNTIESFPDRLDTLIGERGVTLSGGQKQRATLARGLIRKAPVLILDDCFSAVDTETEEHILSELKRVRSGQTTILVSHRVSTARHADNIIVLDEGVVIEKGSHEELLLEGGYYAELERVQREGGQDGDLKNKRAGVR